MIAARLDGVARRFGSVVALAGAEVEVRAGEVHAVLGENGAGKSTLLGILGGMLRPDAGRVEIGGTEVVLRSPREAWSHGIGLVHQHFTLVPTLSVLENLALGRRSEAKGWKLPYERVRADAGALMRRARLDAPLDARVEDLGVGERQRIEILKALLRDPPVLALDEPTAVLSPGEVDALFSLLRDLAAEGRAVLVVAHKIDEVLRVADRITVLRHGRTTLTARRDEVDPASLVAAMVGRGVEERTKSGRLTPMPKRGLGRGAPAATLEGVRARSASGLLALDGVSLIVRRGEIVGIAGVEGNGQRELALVLAGRLVHETGVARVPAGVGFIPQDRTREGLIADFDLTENIALAVHDDVRFRRGAVLRWNDIRAHAEGVRSRFEVGASSVGVLAGTLSGGHQQRLVVGRELARATDLLVAENPTRGLDVAATAFVHEELERLTRTGTTPGVVLVSTDLDEVLRLADRVLVMRRGRLIPLDDADRTRANVGALMLKGPDETA